MVRASSSALDVKIFGAGGAHAAGALAGETPSEVIHVGLGGALTTAFARGDVVHASSVRHGDELLEVESPRRSAFAALPSARIVTSDVPVDAAGKAALHARDAGDVVEMESWPVARACAERGIPWTGLRVIGDALADEIPRPVLDAWDGRRFRIWMIARAAIISGDLRRELGALRRSADAAAARLADVLAASLL